MTEERKAVAEESLPAICCFCLAAIQRNATDPIELAVTSLGSDFEGESGTQGLHCHYQCLRERVHLSVPLTGDGVP